MRDIDHSRRIFLGTMAKAGAVTAAAPLIASSKTLGLGTHVAPSDRPNIAAVGVGGMGRSNLGELDLDRVNVVALCDVDWDYAAETFEEYPDAERYWDYRQMFDEMGDDIDGVMISTPDHTHAIITMAAMERGIHVYTEKPLSWSVWEARQLQEAAERTGVVTQMGNQGHSLDDSRFLVEHLRAGTIGEVNEVHIWTNRPIWPQGMDAPEKLRRKPHTIDWDLYLGPAPDVEYDPSFHPFNWRGWVDYGTGALGDMAAHLMDHPFWAFELDAPVTVETRSTAFNGVSWPHATMTHYEFSRGGEPPLKMVWYDGGFMPPRPEEMGDEDDLNPTGGVLYIGSEGKLLHETQGYNPRFLPEELDQNLPDVPQLFERIPEENHRMNWVRAIRGEEEPSCPFSYAAPLTEAMLLGLVSLQAGNRRIEWEAENLEITNIPEANEFLRREERSGWELPQIA